MNIFKEIGAAMLAAALMTTTAITASASSVDRYHNAEEESAGSEPSSAPAQGGITAKVERMDGGTILTIENIPAKYAECDSIYADIQFTTATLVNGEVTFPGFNRYALRARQDKDGTYGAWIALDKETGEWLGGNEGGSGLAIYSNVDNSYMIGLDEGSKYYEDSFTDFNAVYVEVYGITNNERVNYTKNGELTQEAQAQISIVGDVKEVTETSDTASEQTSDTTSEQTSDPASEQTSDTTSEQTSDTASEQTSDTSSEQTSDTASEQTSDTSSEQTSDTASEQTSDTSSEQTSDTASEQTSDTESDNNPATGAAMTLIPLTLIGSAAAVITKKKK